MYCNSRLVDFTFIFIQKTFDIFVTSLWDKNARMVTLCLNNCRLYNGAQHFKHVDTCLNFENVFGMHQTKKTKHLTCLNYNRQYRNLNQLMKKWVMYQVSYLDHTVNFILLLIKKSLITIHSIAPFWIR